LAEDSLNQGEEPAAVADPVVESVDAFEEKFAALRVGFPVGDFAEAFHF
jgi:hypothetical protein